MDLKIIDMTRVARKLVNRKKKNAPIDSQYVGGIQTQVPLTRFTTKVGHEVQCDIRYKSIAHLVGQVRKHGGECLSGWVITGSSVIWVMSPRYTNLQGILSVLFYDGSLGIQGQDLAAHEQLGSETTGSIIMNSPQARHRKR